jgi:hypothetical protein
VSHFSHPERSVEAVKVIRRRRPPKTIIAHGLGLLVMMMMSLLGLYVIVVRGEQFSHKLLIMKPNHVRV